MIYNPSDEELQQNIALPLHYAGLSETTLDRQYRIAWPHDQIRGLSFAEYWQ